MPEEAFGGVGAPAEAAAAPTTADAQASAREAEAIAAAANKAAELAAEAAARAAAQAAEALRTAAPTEAVAASVATPVVEALEADAIEPPASEKDGTEQGIVAAPPLAGGAKKPSLLVRFLSLFARK